MKRQFIGIGVGIGASIGITIGSVIGSIKGNVGFWISMGVAFVPSFGVIAAIIYGKLKNED
jgi:hypothetical protein